MRARADAATSTEDVKARPLCLFYFSHPFGVLSPDPPAVLGGAPVVARTFLDMRPVPAFRSPPAPDLAWLVAGGRARRTLPPLRPPAPRALPWPVQVPAPAAAPAPRERRALPPIELPLRRRRPRARLSGVQRMLTCLVRRTVKGGGRRASPALRDALRLLRDAWPEPRALRHSGESGASEEARGMWRGELSARAAASPGLLRRRYSVPETIMRKYRLAQQRSEAEEAGRVSGASAATAPARGACGCWRGGRGARRDRELMRKSALLRLWGRAGGSPCRACRCGQPCGTRSLDGSRSELRPAPGWVSPRRPPARCASSSAETPTDAPLAGSSDSEGRARDDFAPYFGTEPTRPPGASADDSAPPEETDELRSLTDSSDTFSTSIPTAKEAPAVTGAPTPSRARGEGGICDASPCAESDGSHVLPYGRPPTAETPSYEILEIVVSETVNVDPPPAAENEPDRLNALNVRSPILKTKKKRNIDIDEYVSNILVESLNSLTDQLESMNASMCADRKLSIVEKEIKVKLQNTGVNTVVHLSPTSNNQIIFGNEELCDGGGRRDDCNNLRDSPSEEIREEPPSPETNNNLTPGDARRDRHDEVNKAVLQQIQKLFRSELQGGDAETTTSDGVPEISHIEISNVDVFIDNNGSFAASDTIEMQTERRSDDFEVLSVVGTGNYYEEPQDAEAIVPRFSAFPHTDSMEVNTSSSEDAEVLGSECTSLVDSLDDPNSPRSVFMRKSFASSKRSELVRSAIDVLDLLPENAQPPPSPKEKGESFFIRIKDDNCDCEKENIVVADHMPETIKQRLYRRHRKRELRMECARRSKVKLLKRELEKQRHKQISKSKKEIERECMAIINALIDDVIAKIAQDEYKCMRIKQRSTRLASAKSEENVSKRHWRRETEHNNNKEIRLIKSDASQSCSEDIGRERRKSERHIRGKLSLQAHPPLTPEEGPRRIYQKSEIRDGTKCIEILEILEYVNSSQSSTDTINSDENQNHYIKNKKSRIPVPVHEKPSQRSHRSNGSRRSPGAGASGGASGSAGGGEPRARSNSLRFKRVFDIIPEERSSLSVDSPDEAGGRRASAPSLDVFSEPRPARPPPAPAPPRTPRVREMRSAGTSPMPEASRSVGAMTSPLRKSASTSPIKMARVVDTARAGGASTRRGAPRCDEEGLQTDRRRCSSTQREGPLPRRAPRPAPAVAGGDRGARGAEAARALRRRAEAAARAASEAAASSEERASTSSSESGGSLLCSLAPAWLHARRRRRRAAHASGEWAVTVAGSCPAALPNDVEMRLRFPERAPPVPRAPRPPHASRRSSASTSRAVERGAECGRSRRRALPDDSGRVTLTVKREASDSSILASKSVKKSSEPLPELETYRASRTKTRSSVRTRRGCSLHCWLPQDEPLPIRNNGLSVLGCAIVPELKPRAPSMSERDLRARRHSLLRA